MSDFLTLNMDAGERQIFPSEGRCIYCGEHAGKLSDEHIIPLALTGNSVVIKEAVCESCRLETHPYEARVLQKMYGNLRVQIDAPTRRPAKRSSKLLHTFVLLTDDGEKIREQVVEREWDRSPVACPSWYCPEPAILHGGTPSLELPGRKWSYVSPSVSSFINEVKRELGHSGPIAYKVGDVFAEDYLRFVAKIAHAYAVAVFGFDAFEHLLPPIVRCRDNAVSYLVGGDPIIAPPVPDGAAVRIDFGHPIEGSNLLLAKVRLFEFLGTPEHLVVVGRTLTRELPRRQPL